MSKNIVCHEIRGAISAKHALVLVDGAISAASTSAWQGLGTAAFASPRAYKTPNNMAAKRGAPPRGNPSVI